MYILFFLLGFFVIINPMQQQAQKQLQHSIQSPATNLNLSRIKNPKTFDSNGLMQSNNYLSQSKQLLEKLEAMKMEDFLQNPFAFPNISLQDPSARPLFDDLCRMYPGMQIDRQLTVSHYCLLHCIRVASLEAIQFHLSPQARSALRVLYNGLPAAVKSYLSEDPLITRNKMNILFLEEPTAQTSNALYSQQLELPVEELAAGVFEDNAIEEFVAPCPLNNFGNTCYINALLQVFWNTPEIRKFLHSCIASANTDSVDSITYELVSLFTVLSDQDYSTYDTALQAFIAHIKAYCNFDSQQQDAHELYIKLIDALRQTSLFNFETCFLRKQTFPFCDFLVRVRTLTHTQNGHRSHEELTLESMISVGIPSGRNGALSLKDLLDCYFVKERLTDVNKSQQSFINYSEKPVLFAIQIKRFDGLSKNLRHIALPEVLDIAPYCNGRERDPIAHALHAIVVHDGDTLTNGHYYTYVKGENGWYCCNDTSITHASVNEFIALNANNSTRTPYMVFYKKADGMQVAIPCVTQAASIPPVAHLQETANDNKETVPNKLLQLLRNQNSEFFNKKITNNLLKLAQFEPKTLTKQPCALSALCISNDGKYLFIGSQNGNIDILAIQDPKRIRHIKTLTGHSKPVRAFELNDSGNYLF